MKPDHRGGAPRTTCGGAPCCFHKHSACASTNTGDAASHGFAPVPQTVISGDFERSGAKLDSGEAASASRDHQKCTKKPTVFETHARPASEGETRRYEVISSEKRGWGKLQSGQRPR